jgi:hypothetical protein
LEGTRKDFVSSAVAGSLGVDGRGGPLDERLLIER